MKRILLALAALFLTVPAQAQELHPDSGMTTSVGVMEHGDTADVSITGGKAVFTGPDKHTALHWTNVAGVKRGRWYRTKITVSENTAGTVNPTVGPMMQASIPGSWVVSPNAPGVGADPIADNFTTADGLDDGPGTAPLGGGFHVDGESGSDDGAWRINCGPGPIRPIDPLVYPGLIGASHLHQFFGNTEVHENSTPAKLRVRGMTTCGSADQPNRPINRSAYWLPPIIDHKLGKAVSIDWLNLYYKQPNNTNDAVKCAGQDGTGTCVNMPRQMRMITGYNIALDTGKPDVGSAISFWVCVNTDGSEWGTRGSMSNAIANCAAAGLKKLHWQVAFQNCWNGTNLDSPDHRSHVAYSDNTGKCPSTHKYHIPQIGLLVYWTINQNAIDGHWRMSSDSMNPGVAPGDSAHTDYMEAWSPTQLDALWANCINRDLSCSGGDFGNGTHIDISPRNIAGGTTGFSPNEGPGRYVSLGPSGIGRHCYVTAPATTKTCVSDVYAVADGVIGLSTDDGFVGKVDEFSVKRITRAGGPVVIPR